jgi:hypothetical protein
MDIIDLISKVWPICLAAITLIIVLAKLEQRMSAAEEKIRTLFELYNRDHDDNGHHRHHRH